MNKDISSNELNTQLPFDTKEKILSQSPIQPQHNINKHLNQLRFSPLSPQPRFIEPPEGFELNAKNFPSKVNVCKGQSPSSINHYSVHSNNSPIVQYYAGLTKSPTKDNLAKYSPDHQGLEGKPFYQINYQQNQGPIHHNFNFSPSAIFNSTYHKRSSNSSIDVNNSSSKAVPFLSKTLQEKIEGHFSNKENHELKEVKVNTIEHEQLKLKENQSNHDEEEEEDEGISSDDAFKLDFDSYEEDEDNEEDKANKEQKNKNKMISHPHEEIQNINLKQNNKVIDEISSPMNEVNINDKNININSNIIIPNITPLLVSNSTIASNTQNILNINNEDTQIPINVIKGKNKFDEANIHYYNTNTPQVIDDVILNNENNIPNNSLPTNTNNVININTNIYYPQQMQMNNYYPYARTEIPQQSYYENQYFPNQQYMKDNISFTYIEDQSTLIEDKKNNNKKIKRLDPQSYQDQPYEELAKNICNLAKDQGGCRYLQKKLEEDPINATNCIYPALINHILKFINDPFGNYLIQKLFNNLNEAQLNEVLMIISKNILDIGINSHGTRVIQQLINHLSSPKLIELFATIIKPFIVPLLNELNGTHIIQKFCNDYPAYGYNINLIIIENCLALASHRHGCCVLQKYLETFDRELHLKLLNKLISNCLILVIDQFGNYVIQSIFYLGNVNASNAIALKLLNDICFYSKHKYSSNVVEKCFDYCDDFTRLKLIEVLALPESVNDLILDEHGNYVIQKVLACSHFKTQSTILQYIVPLFSKLQVLPFGEHIISRLLVSYPQLNSKVSGIDIKTFRGKQGFGINANTKYNYNTQDNDYNNYNYQGNKNYNYQKNNKGYNKNDQYFNNNKRKQQQYK